MTSPRLPGAWHSALPYVEKYIPPDLQPPVRDAEAVKINLPLALLRQNVQLREYWPIPDDVAAAYSKYRPTPLWRATGFERAVGARVPIYVKYEGSNIAGSHKFNTAIAQAHYYSAAGARELATGTGAGQWGAALAAACSVFGLRCTVFMVGSSLSRKPYRGALMRALGATVHSSPSGMTEISRKVAEEQVNSLALAIGEAVEYARAADGVAFSIGSGETYSLLHQSVIGVESAEQLAQLGAEVDAVVGCVGGGSNFGGLALPFFADAAREGRKPPALVAAESAMVPKLTRGVYAYDHPDATGSGPMEAMYTVGSSYVIPDSHSAGLRYHGAAKLISAMRHHGLIEAVAFGEVDALEAGLAFARTELALPAPESGHALAAAARLAAGGAGGLRAEHGVVVVVSGNGYLDLTAYQQLLDGQLVDAAPAEEELGRAALGLRRVDAGMGQAP